MDRKSHQVISRKLEDLMQDCENIIYTKKHSRKVPGNLIDFIWHYQFLISDCSGFKHWIRIKQDWGLSMDQVEADSIQCQMKACE